MRAFFIGCMFQVHRRALSATEAKPVSTRFLKELFESRGRFADFWNFSWSGGSDKRAPFARSLFSVCKIGFCLWVKFAGLFFESSVGCIHFLCGFAGDRSFASDRAPNHFFVGPAAGDAEAL